MSGRPTGTRLAGIIEAAVEQGEAPPLPYPDILARQLQPRRTR